VFLWRHLAVLLVQGQHTEVEMLAGDVLDVLDPVVRAANRVVQKRDHDVPVFLTKSSQVWSSGGTL